VKKVIILSADGEKEHFLAEIGKKVQILEQIITILGEFIIGRYELGSTRA
jgi:hypothetical protein